MNIKKVAIITGFAVIVLVAVYLIALPSVKPDKNQEKQDKKDEEILDKNYIPEKFPLAKGMYGECTRKVRAVMGLAPTNIFDEELEATLYSKYKIKQVTQTVYNFYKKFYTPNV